MTALPPPDPRIYGADGLRDEGYHVPTYLRDDLTARKISTTIPVSKCLIGACDDDCVCRREWTPTPPTRRERLASWWWNTRQTVGEWVAGRAFDEGDDW